ncbi:ATP-binding protein [Sphingomonas lenta]|uniref:histidine kinase n=1 Tax=Sphingomonas lenta TaxID=1141887 RepID=A0A2A2SIY2_9SPHN|nr:ATP-binding protein [Sphingomonas lenta]PAX09202.1 histidine kinase [Sphingomonas lenta]
MTALPRAGSRWTRWWADRPLATKGLVVVALPLMILLLSVLSLHRIGQAEASAERDVSTTFAIQADVHQVHALLAEAASGVRGYRFTGQGRFLEPYVKAEAALPSVLARLRTMVRDAEARRRLDRIEALAARKRDGLAVLRDAPGAGRADAADPALLAALVRNKQVLDALRREIAQLQARERVLLAERQRRAETVRSRALVLTAAAALLGVAGGLIAVFLFSSGIVRRVQRLQRDAELLARGEPLPPFPDARDEVGALAHRMQRAGELLRAREKALREGEERFRLVVEGVRDYGIFALDPDGRVVSWNAGAERIKGWTADEILGRHFSVFYPEDRRAEWPGRNLADAAANGRAEDEGWRVRKDGTRFWANVVITALRDDAGRLRGFSKVTRDITERRRAEEALDAARLEAEAANRAKSVFLSRMSHELRTPLNAVLGFAQLLELDAVGRPKGEREAVAQILRGGRHLLSLIDEVLDIARIEAGGLQLSLEPVALRALIDEAVALTAPQADAKGVAVEVTGDPDLAATADRRRVLQVLLNLLSNAVKYNHPGGRVRVTAEPRGPGVSVTVADTGVGVEPDGEARLFQPFQRIGAAAQASEGTGLGLALSRGLVEAMGGEIGYLGPADGSQGARFWFRLPRALPPPSAPAVDIPAPPSGDASHDAPTILLIEDNLANARLIETIVSRAFPRARLLLAMQATIGLALAREHRPRLVLLDLHLPDHPGEWVLERLAGPDAPTVFVLTADAPAAAKGGRPRQAAEVFTKPLDVARLLDAMRRLLSAKEPA